MLKGVDNNWGKVLCELRPFSFAILDDIVCKIKEGQFTGYLGWKKKRGGNHTSLNNIIWVKPENHIYTWDFHHCEETERQEDKMFIYSHLDNT